VSFLEDVGGMGRASAALFRHRLIVATAGTAAAVIVVGGAFAVTTAHGSTQGQQSGSGKTGGQTTTTGKSGQTSPSPSAAPVAPLSLLSVSPSGGTHHVNGGDPITLKFSSALSPSTPLPKLSPSVAGTWKVSGATATFTPASGFLPDTKVTLKVPGGKHGMAGAATGAGTLKKASTVKFETGTYSTLRLQQILAQLGYLPLSWNPAESTKSAASVPDTSLAAAGGTSAALHKQVLDAYDPPAGTFTMKSGYPSQLTSQWKVGQDNLINQGAIRAFQNAQGLNMDGVAGPDVWSHLLTAAAKHQVNPNGYTYALANQASPQSLTIWHNGKVLLHTLANTGVVGAGTQDGTYPVYLRYQSNWMNGTNPDGSKYHDMVYWISYFNGGDAVHYFPRYSYGYYQSVGCVEVPLAPAEKAWQYMTYGTLVTVTGPEA
jgi:peptidoglycan hydrolase-like protein with peptidoglycan-binding domain